MVSTRGDGPSKITTLMIVSLRGSVSTVLLSILLLLLWRLVLAKNRLPIKLGFLLSALSVSASEDEAPNFTSTS